MRAAHSIKGAARIIGLDAVVNLAHTMEDCFVAAQNRALKLNSVLVDSLLRGVDLLQELSQMSDRQIPIWLTEHRTDLHSAQTLIQHPQQLQLHPTPHRRSALRSPSAWCTCCQPHSPCTIPYPRP